MKNAQSTANRKDGEKSLGKMLEILEYIAGKPQGCAGREISEQLAIPVSTVFRMLKFLVAREYLRSANNVYTLGFGLARLGAIAQAQNPLAEVARPFLRELAAATRETVHLAVIHHHAIVYIDKVEGQRSVRMASLIGSPGPVHCTGVGKAMLAFLEDSARREILAQVELTSFTAQTRASIETLNNDLAAIRERGYAIDDCEHEEGVYCVAAPVFACGGEVIAGLSVSGSELYLRQNTVELAAQVMLAARRISAALGHITPS